MNNDIIAKYFAESNRVFFKKNETEQFSIPSPVANVPFEETTGYYEHIKQLPEIIYKLDWDIVVQADYDCANSIHEAEEKILALRGVITDKWILVLLKSVAYLTMMSLFPTDKEFAFKDYPDVVFKYDYNYELRCPEPRKD